MNGPTRQNDAIVADYFSMLADDIARRAYSKAEHNRPAGSDLPPARFDRIQASEHQRRAQSSR